jgi:hypothetical protein
VLALLEEAGLVHDEQPATRLAQVVQDEAAQVVAHALHVPDRPIEQALDALWPSLADGLRHLPPIFALHSVEEAEHVALGPLAHFPAGEALRDALVELRQHLRPSRPGVVGGRDATMAVAQLCRHGPAPFPRLACGGSVAPGSAHARSVTVGKERVEIIRLFIGR